MKIGIVGFGSLGRALYSGLVRQAIAPADITVFVKPARIAEISALGSAATDDIAELFATCDTIFLVVKGYVFAELAPKIPRHLIEGKTIVSFMAGVPFDTITNQIGACTLVRAMPSIAIEVCDGVIGYTEAPPEVEAILKNLGYAFKCEPDEIEKVTAFSACGLGFAAYMIDAFAKAGESLGFSYDDAQMIATRTFRNATDRGRYAETVAAVATKGGATEQGILHMQSAGLNAIAAEAVLRAYKKMT